LLFRVFCRPPSSADSSSRPRSLSTKKEKKKRKKGKVKVKVGSRPRVYVSATRLAGWLAGWPVRASAKHTRDGLTVQPVHLSLCPRAKHVDGCPARCRGCGCPEHRFPSLPAKPVRGDRGERTYRCGAERCGCPSVGRGCFPAYSIWHEVAEPVPPGGPYADGRGNGVSTRHRRRRRRRRRREKQKNAAPPVGSAEMRAPWPRSNVSTSASEDRPQKRVEDRHSAAIVAADTSTIICRRAASGCFLPLPSASNTLLLLSPRNRVETEQRDPRVSSRCVRRRRSSKRLAGPTAAAHRRWLRACCGRLLDGDEHERVSM